MLNATPISVRTPRRARALVMAVALSGLLVPAAAADGWARDTRSPRLSPAPEALRLKGQVTDPQGDTIGTGTPQLDLTFFGAEVVGSNLVIEQRFTGTVSGADSSNNDALGGFIDIDTDQNGATGDIPWTDLFGGNTGMGNEYYVDLFSYTSATGSADVIDDVTDVVVGQASVTFTGTALTVAVPLTLIGNDPLVDLATVIGTLAEATDIAPNSGAIDSAPDTGPPTSVLLQDNRFRVEIDWQRPPQAPGLRPAFVSELGTDDSALFYFNNPNNLEFLIKVIDACSTPANRFWVFFAATTDVEFTVTVTDTATNAVNQYFNPLGQPADAVTDTQAFATCP